MGQSCNGRWGYKGYWPVTRVAHCQNCTVRFSILQVYQSEVDEHSIDLWRSHASLRLSPFNHAVQHLRGLSPGQGASLIVGFIEFACHMLLFVLIKIPDCVKRKGFRVISSGNSHRLKVSSIPHCEHFEQSLHSYQTQYTSQEK